MRSLGQDLWNFTKDCGCIARRSLWNCAKSYVQLLSIILGAFYFWASYRVPPGHLLNWHEFWPILVNTFNLLMSRILAGGCGQ
jgi:hypothetical protein